VAFEKTVTQIVRLMKIMKNDDLTRKFNLSKFRTFELYKHVGAVSTYFAGLELQLIDVLASCINPDKPDRVDIALSQLSFRQCVTTFGQLVPKLYPKQDIISQVKKLSKRLTEVSSKRNDIIHSSWIAYSTGNYGQHTARSKSNPSVGHRVQSESPKKSMQKLITDIDELLFDLICFKDELKKEDSKQAGAGNRP